ncbi:MAG TPA: 3-methyl-2-oxobutanoate hydroxymethyltransferase [Acidimicrobiales bacterium]|nr:3-methyl-2-oxobutanoate hydroxymethyltransferase [Acidimicrobiales bacterium]
MPTTVLDLRRFKDDGHRFAMLTCYDYQCARIFDEAGIPVLLVGDTLGIMVLGHDTTIPVTMEAMVHHCRAVSRGARHALVVGDLPFGSYEISTTQGVANALRLVKDGGVAVVKLEGPDVALIEALTVHGIPVMGHLGLTPQSFHAMGGNKVQARTEEAAARLLDDARRVEAAGACAVVLEAIPSEVARRVTEALGIPTIGIGAGPHCDGQVLVSTEMLGMSTGPSPRFAKRYADLGAQAAAAARAFARDVACGSYPDPEHSYDWALR